MRGDAGWCRSFLDQGSLLTCTSLGRWSGSVGYQKHASCCLDSGRAVGKDLLFYVGIALRSSGSNRASSHSVSFRPGVASQHMLEGVEVSTKCVGRRSSDSHRQRYRTQLVRLKPAVLGSAPMWSPGGGSSPRPLLRRHSSLLRVRTDAWLPSRAS
jgi:hypothetical protein